MTNMDILAMIHRGNISSEEAEDLFEKTIEHIHRCEISQPWWDILGLSSYEATAIAHGAGFEDVATFRYEGWPRYCYRCKLPLDYLLYGWWFEYSDDETPYLRHIRCPNIEEDRSQ